MADNDRMVVFVHGWSVQNTDTYGELPRRLAQEAQRQQDLRLDVHNILLGKYISFRDEVRLQDVSRAFQRALEQEQELNAQISAGRRFVCITHSTGGPVVRDWWNRFYRESTQPGPCPMSHLIMLAPANFGSALAQVGKGTGARLKTAIWDGVQPGTGILDWLELGSSESWELNTKWIAGRNGTEDDPPVFPFVLTGQSIDRKIYDHLNSYTGESGSDGVVRTAAANLNASYFRLEQGTEEVTAGSSDEPTKAFALNIVANQRAPRTAFALIPRRSHSGDMGIMRSVKNDGRRHPTVEAVLKCLLVSNRDEYLAACDTFAAQSRQVREDERVETVSRLAFLPDGIYFHDSHTMVIFRVRDDRGYPVDDFDLTLIGKLKRRFGPNFLPKGFFVDRQKNGRESGVLTYYFSYDALTGLPAVRNPKDKKEELRPELPGADGLGLEVKARPADGFVHYVPAALQVSKDVLQQFIKSDETVLVDIVLRRVVHEGVFQLSRTLAPEPFTDQPPGAPIP